jgi:hypothetical protein
MPVTIESVFTDAMSLPEGARADLVGRLLSTLEASIDPDLERAHLDVVHRRLDEMISGAVEGVPVAEGLARVRAMVRR